MMRPNLFDVGQTLYICYTHVFSGYGILHSQTGIILIHNWIIVYLHPLEVFLTL